MKKKYVYKCVRIRSQNTYESCSPPNSKLALHYRIGVWTKAWNGTPGIFVFDTFRRAKEFASHGLVLKCEYVGEPIRLTRRLDIYYGEAGALGYKSLVSIFSTPEKREKMIDRINDHRFARFKALSPCDTCVVNAVKPISISHPKKESDLKRKLSRFVKSIPFNKKLLLPEWMHNKWRIKR